MSALPTQSMTVEEFLAWAEGQPGRHELVAGRVCAIAPERALHAETKLRTGNALAEGIRHAGLACHALPDGMTVRIDDATAYEPDALVYCGRKLPDEAIEVPEPIIIIEIVSPSTKAYDAGAKLEGYFKLASVRHYLIVVPNRRRVIHHARQDDGRTILTSIASGDDMELSPPGMRISVADLFAT
jgi:Uma2 family endonuclease